MINKRLIVSCLFLFAGAYAYGQSPLYFTGYGRALVSKSALDKNSEMVKDDSTSTKQSLEGNFVFDLGVNVNPNEQFKTNAILRVANEFGGFYSSGSLLEFRQIQIQGVLAKKFLYNLGDIDLSMTKYTLFNSFDPTYSEFEGEAFKIRRGIVEYENFNNGNKWRLQGAQTGTTIRFNKVIQEIGVSAFGTRSIASNYLNVPDRLLYGGTLKVRQSKYLEIGGNAIALSDIAGTVQDTVVFYKNSVLTGEYKISLSSRTINFSTFGELGRSFYDLNLVDAKQQVKKTDGFFDVGVNATHRYKPLSAVVSYRLVGPDFSSPGAQTMRMLDYQTGVLLPTGMNGALTREQGIFDRMSDLNLYNRSLSTVYMNFNPAYNNSTPYGAATPNRKGTTTDIKYGNKDSLVYINVHAQVLSEVLGVGIKDKRNFLLINPGLTFNVNRLFNLNRLMALSGSVRYEKTTGSKSANIDLTSTMIDGSLTVETFKGLDLIGGAKMISAKGNEILSIHDGFNQIQEYSLWNTNFNQMVYSGGVRYRLTNYIFMAFNAFVSDNNNPITTEQGNKMKQYYFSYIMRF